MDFCDNSMKGFRNGSLDVGVLPMTNCVYYCVDRTLTKQFCLFIYFLFINNLIV